MGGMKKILIYGASFFDVVKLIGAINRVSPTWNVLGFLDDTPGARGKVIHGFPVLGGRELLPEYAGKEGVFFFNNINASRTARRKVGELLSGQGCRMASLVHPGVDLAYVQLGVGCIIPEGCVIGANVRIGDHVTVRYGCVISHDVTIGDDVLLGPGVTVGGRATIKQGSEIGAGATVMLEKTVGEFSTVGAGAVVARDVEPGVTVAGIPARIIRGKKA